MNNGNHRGKWKQRLTVLTVAGALTLGLATVPAAVGAPESKEDRIARLESAIAANRVKSDAAQLAYAQSAEAYAQATDALNEATAEAAVTAKKADAAKKEADAAKAKLGRLAVVMYRQRGTGMSDLAAITESEFFHDAALKESVTDVLGSQADSQAQGLTALQNVAEVMREKADAAAAAKRDATKDLARTEKTARDEAQAALDELKQIESQRDRIIAELAREREVSIAQEKARQELVEQQRQAALAAAAEKKRKEQEALAAQRAAQLAAQQEAERKERERRAEAERIAREQAAQNPSPGAPANPAPAPNPTPKPEKPAPQPATPPSSAGAGGYGPSLLEWSRTKLGVPYVWGGIGPNGYDCSGLVYAGMKELGRNVQRSAAAQYNAYANVPFSQRQPGDLVFWSNNGTGNGVYHVAIYAGGDTLLMAPKPGDVVRIVGFYNQHKMMPFVARL